MARRILEIAAGKTGHRGRIEHVADRPGHDRRYAMDTSRLRALGWRPRVSLAEGLERTGDWILQETEGATRRLAAASA